MRSERALTPRVVERRLNWVDFSPSANYTIPIPGPSTITGDVFSKTRRTTFGGSAPIVHPDGATGVATMQHKGVSRTGSQIESTYPNGEAGSMERAAGVWRVAYNTGEALTASACRSQLSCYPIMPGYVSWDINVQFGDADYPWDLTANSVSPALIWQCKPSDGSPCLSFVVDTDALDSAKLEIAFVRRVTKAGGATRLATASGISRHVPVLIRLDALMSYASDGWANWYVDGTLVHAHSGSTLATDTTSYHQSLWGLYMYNNTVPGDAPTRVTFWRDMTQRQAQLPERGTLGAKR